LPSLAEVVDNVSDYSANQPVLPGEGNQYEYFKTQSNRIIGTAIIG